MTIRALVDQFVSQLEAEIRRSALEAITASLGASAKPAAPKRVTKAKTAPAPKARPAKAAKPATRVSRSPADLDRDVGRLVAFVRANNGATNEKVRAALKLSKTEWT